MTLRNDKFSNYIFLTVFITLVTCIIPSKLVSKLTDNDKKNGSNTFEPCILDYPGKPAGSPERENLGPNVNSKYLEIAPVISADGKFLYFIRAGHPSNKEGSELINQRKSQDIWVSELKDGQWQKANNIGAPLNNKNPNGVWNISPDGTSLLLMNEYHHDGRKGMGFSVSHKYIDKDSNVVWSFPDTLDIENFYNLSRFTSANLTSDGKILLISLQRFIGKGKLDLYFSRNLGNNKWSKPTNLGSIVNTPGNETSPFLAADGKTLYFASDGHCTYGGYDIFYTKRLDDTWTNWSEPVNLGPEINTPESEKGYFLTAKGDYAYFNNEITREDGSIDMDLFRIKIPEKSQPEPVYLISGVVTDASTQKNMAASIIYDDRETGEQLGIAKTNPSTGKYKIVVPGGKKYGIRAEADGYMAISKILSSEGIQQYEEIELNLALNPVIINKPIVVDNIYFDFGLFELKQESYYKLNNIADFLKKNEKTKVEISGHTDNVGSNKDNMTLSKNRAKSVVEYLIAKGIDTSRIRYVGYGETKPIADNNTEEGRERNRRVELEFVD